MMIPKMQMNSGKYYLDRWKERSTTQCSIRIKFHGTTLSCGNLSNYEQPKAINMFLV